MVRIENIKRNGDVVTMDCYAEGKKDKYFYLEMNCNTFQIISNTVPDMSVYESHARQCIRKLLMHGNALPNHTTSMWY